MLRLVPDQTTIRWGDPITVRYEGDLDDLATWTAMKGTLRVVESDAAVPFAGDVTFGAAYTTPVLPGYVFHVDPDDGASFTGATVDTPPPDVRSAIIVGRVTTLRGQTAVSCTVQIARRMPVGWCPPNSIPADVTAMLGKFPDTQVMRIFRGDGEGLPAWDSGVIAAIPNHVQIILSIKGTAAALATAIGPWARAMPADRPPIYVCWWHEPEQQTGGDPTPTVYRAGWQQILSAGADQSWRARVLFACIFTEYAATKGARAASWMAEFGIVGTLPGMDAVGFDIYNTGYPLYREPEQMFGFALEYARRVGKPLLVAEWGIERKTTIDPTGAVCAQVMLDQAAYLRRQPEAAAATWFYRGGCNLDERPAERSALLNLTRGA